MTIRNSMDISFPFLNLKSLNIALNKILNKKENQNNSISKEIKAMIKKQEGT